RQKASLTRPSAKPDIRAFALEPKDDRPVSYSRPAARTASSVSPTHATSGIENTYVGPKRSVVVLYSKPKAWHTATLACSIATEARPGGPIRSPAAHTPGAVVAYRSSTLTQPRSSTLTPASASPRSLVPGRSPMATS